MRIEDTAEIVEELVENDADRDELYEKIDDAVNCVFEPSSALTELPFIKDRHYALPDIADAKNAGVRTFSVLLPNISVQPNSDNEYEYERVERMEEALKWEFHRMNRVGTDSIHSKIIDSAIQYHAVALQTQYLPYHYKGRKSEPRVKAILRQRNFNWILHHPASVHVMRGRDGNIDGVAKVGTYTAKQLRDEFGKDNPGIRKMMEENEDFDTTEWTLVDWTDWENRQIWAIPSLNSVSKTEYVIMDEEHKLPFIPWVVVDKGNPLWQSVISSGLWANIQHMNVIRFAKAIEQAATPAFAIQTPDGSLKNVWIDYSNPNQPISLPPGSQLMPVQRPQIDPQLEQHYQEMRAAIQRSTVSQVLTDIGQYSNAPFSTVNQIVQMALGQLGPAKLVAEEAEAKGFYQMFEWIEHSKIPLIAYRANSRDGATGEAMKKGEEIGIFPGQAQEPDEFMTPEMEKNFRRRIYFDLDYLYIDVAMNSQNTADEQARQNVLINAITHMGASKEFAWEKMGWSNYQTVEEQRAAETLQDAEVQKIVQMKLLEVQAAQMEMQMAAQQAQQPQNANADLNAENSMSTMQGADMRGGMNPAAQANPSMTRERVTGTDAIGAEL